MFKHHEPLLVLYCLVGCSPLLTPPSPDDALTCENYCDTVLASCGLVMGKNGGTAQYLSREGCLAQCASMPRGAETDKEVDSVGCRLRAAKAAAVGNKEENCRAAGAVGGGVCGRNRCAAFCKQVTTRCTAAYTSMIPYANEAECLAACGPGRAFDFDVSKPEVFFEGADLNCRIAHLVASFDPGEGFGPPSHHCWHTDVKGTGGFCAR
jgi:hypothetical protein